jgi:hypothetical protein
MESTLGWLVSIATLAVILIGLPSQIYKNYKEKSFGMSILLISLGVVLLIFRISYTLVRHDYYILIPDIISILIHIILFYQFFLYRKSK